MVPALLLVALLLISTGCTQRETRGQYEKELARIHQLRTATLHELDGEQDDVRYLTRARMAILDAVDDMKRISPPREVERAHQRYISSLEGMADVLARMASCARLERSITSESEAGEGRAAECRQAIDSTILDQIENDFSEAEAIYRQEGYDLPEVKESS